MTDFETPAERDLLMCPSCFRNHRAWAFGTICPFCGSKGKPASEVVGADWLAIKNRHVTPDDDCHHFDQCSENACPLHPNYGKFEKDRRTNKKAFRCRLRRTTREQIGSRWPELLPNRGLTTREKLRDIRRTRARAKWNALSEEERGEILSKLAKLRVLRDMKRTSRKAEGAKVEELRS